MNAGDSVSGQVKLVNPNGLHLSPITALVREASRFSADIQISFAGKSANAKSTMELMILGATCGAELVIEAVGEDADAAVSALVEHLGT